MRTAIAASIFALTWIAAAVAAEAVATTDGETPGTRLDVKDLKRGSDGTVMMRFAVFNDGDKALSLNELMKADRTDDWHSVDGVYLLDSAGKKKYLVIRDSDQHCICSRNLPDLPAKSSGNYWAKFPAPPDSVEKIGIVVPHFIPMDDVALGK
jgi:hypothetical protein